MTKLDKSQIVVTGAAGFIGSYLVKTLLRNGIDPTHIVAVDDLSFFDTRPCTRSFRSKELLYLSPEDFTERFLDGSILPRAVFHIGACSNTEELRVDYLKKVNFDYTKTLWDRAVQSNTPFLYASSAATYGDGEQGFDDEPTKIPNLKPLNPYGQSKQAFDLFVLEQIKANQVPNIWAGFKYFNVYGPGEDHKASQASVLFHARKQVLANGKIRLFESDRPDYKHGEQLRDFVWVGDVAAAMLFFATGAGKNGIYNVGTGTARSFNDLAHSVTAALKIDCKIEYIPMPSHLKGRYQYFTKAEISRLRDAGFNGKFLSLEEGAKKYFEEDPI
jgi:ADP-L-glycero-D-manno-heptose 6-epimerase